LHQDNIWYIINSILPTLPDDITPTPHELTTTNFFFFIPTLDLPAQPNTMSWFQKQFTLPPRSRGSYLVTDHVLTELPEIRDYKVGMLNLFVQHTSCAISLNENWDDDVRADMSDALDRIAPADRKGTLYRHSAEGEDDMPVGFWSSSDKSSMAHCFCGSGSYQILPRRSLGQYPHQQRPLGHRHLAGYLAIGVPQF
jgi:thiamine phosphate synthase YjbQ (UPF0047 family)